MIMLNTCTILKNKLSYSDNGRGRVIIFLPGLDGKSDIWQEQVQELSQNYRVICLDLSEITPEFISIHNLVKLVDEFIDYIEIKSAILAGYSVGGYLAMLYAIRHPSMVESVIITSLGQVGSINDIANYYMTEYENPKSYIVRLFAQLFKRKSDNYYFVSRFANILKNGIIAQEYNKIVTPLLIINGESDSDCIHALSSDAYDKRGSFIIELEVISGGEKDCFRSNSSEYNSLLKDFIERTISPL